MYDPFGTNIKLLNMGGVEKCKGRTSYGTYKNNKRDNCQNLKTIMRPTENQRDEYKNTRKHTLSHFYKVLKGEEVPDKLIKYKNKLARMKRFGTVWYIKIDNVDNFFIIIPKDITNFRNKIFNLSHSAKANALKAKAKAQRKATGTVLKEGTRAVLSTVPV